jgi:hydroxyethylthiazole kinase
MTRVTGLGCSCSAVIGAFIAESAARGGGILDTSAAGGGILEAVTAGAALFALCGEIAAENAPGPGTLQVALLDKLHNITEEEFVSRLKTSS